jgi:hypothetical protein
VQVFKSDYKVIETAARANLCVYILKAGTIQGKWSLPNFGKARKQVEEAPLQTPAQSHATDSLPPAVNN